MELFIKILVYSNKEYAISVNNLVIWLKLTTSKTKNLQNLPKDGHMNNSWSIYSTFHTFPYMGTGVHLVFSRIFGHWRKPKLLIYIDVVYSATMWISQLNQSNLLFTPLHVHKLQFISSNLCTLSVHTANFVN